MAPVTEPGVTSWPVNLPQGVWFDFLTGERLEGGQVLQRPVTIDTIPVLVKAGSFIPMTDNLQRTDDYQGKALTLHYYADQSVAASQYSLFEDDGVTPDSVAKGQYELLHFAATAEDNKLTLNFNRDGGEYQGKPASRDLTLVLHNQRGKARKIYLDGRYIPIVAQPQRFARGNYVAWYDKANQQLKIKLPLTADSKQLLLQY